MKRRLRVTQHAFERILQAARLSNRKSIEWPTVSEIKNLKILNGVDFKRLRVSKRRHRKYYFDESSELVYVLDSKGTKLITVIDLNPE